jgi:hypothetical protein
VDKSVDTAAHTAQGCGISQIYGIDQKIDSQLFIDKSIGYKSHLTYRCGNVL